MSSPPVRHGFLITAYRDIDRLIALLRCLGPEAAVYVHLDRKSVFSPGELERLKQAANLRHLSRTYRINWGSDRHLKAILELCRTAVADSRCDRLHLITGSDQPVVEKRAFTAFFLEHRDEEYIEHFPLPTRYWKGGGLDRITRYHPLAWLNLRKPVQRRIRDLLLLIQQRLGIKRSIRSLPPLHGGSTWWSLTAACVAHVLDHCDRQPGYLRRFRHTHVPEEIFFQTLLLNSPFADRIINDNLRYVEWSKRDGRSPAILDMRDLERIVASGKLFARKLDLPLSEPLIVALSARACAS